MPAAPLPRDEDERLDALYGAAILDTAREPFFDDAATQIAQSLGTPIALVSLIDESRQWFKAHHGLETAETPREYALCAYAILDSEPLVVTDARRDERFMDSPLVTGAPHVIAYAGAPITLECGARIGTVCAIDHTPRQWSDADISRLRDAAHRTAQHIDARRAELERDPQRYLEMTMFGASLDDEAA